MGSMMYEHDRVEAESLSFLEEEYGIDVDLILDEAGDLVEELFYWKDSERTRVDQAEFEKLASRDYKGKSPFKNRAVMNKSGVNKAGRAIAKSGKKGLKSISVAQRRRLRVSKNRVPKGNRAVTVCRNCKCKNYVCKCTCVQGRPSGEGIAYYKFTRTIDMKKYRKRKLMYMKLYRLAKKLEQQKAAGDKKAAAETKKKFKQEVIRTAKAIKRRGETMKSALKRASRVAQKVATKKLGRRGSDVERQRAYIQYKEKERARKSKRGKRRK